MSIFSKLGKAIGHGVKDVGHFVGKVASNPLVDAGLSFIPGVGPIAAGAAAGLGRLMAPGGNLGNAIGAGVRSGIVGKLAGALPGAGSIGKTLEGLPGISGIMQHFGGQQQQPQGSGFDLHGLLGKLGGAAGDYFAPGGKPDFGKILGAAGGAFSLYGQHEAQNAQQKLLNRQTDMQDQLMQQAQNDYNSRAGLRNAAISKLNGLMSQPNPADVYTSFLAKERKQQAKPQQQNATS